jgi:UDP:flavonoid glycosyltransferase YjiC (YdhE family)
MQMVEQAGFAWVHTPTLSMREILDTLENKLVPQFYKAGNVESLFQAEDQLLRDYKPDIIIRDLFRELTGIAAKQYGIYDVFVQQANVSPYYHTDFKPRNTPWFCRLTPGEKSFVPPLLRFGEWCFRRKASRYLHRKTKQLGLALERKSYEGAEADLILIPDSEILFPFRGMKDKYKYIGPLLVLNQVEPPSWADEFASDPRQKIITTSGSTGEQDRTELFVEAFKDGRYAVAIHSDSRKIPKGFYGGNFEVSFVIRQADVFITHGGLGSTYLGLINGIPMIALYSHFEQQATASQLRKLGAGISLDSMKTSPKELREKTEKVLNNPLFKEQTRRVSGQLNGTGAIDLAVKYITEGYKKFKIRAS